jgi:hypothetical protein
MSVICKLSRLFFAAALFVTGQASMGQTYHPFAEPLEFDPDWQFFAPVELQDVEELAPKKRANYGWFGTYDRANVWVSRSDAQPSSSQGDFTWGNRFDFGLMTEKDSGWSFTAWHVDGPNVYDNIYQERINRFNEDDDRVNDPTADPVFPRGDRNDRTYNERVYIIQDSLNVANYTSFEANKTWRCEPYRYGGILEPLVGLRYAKFKDWAINDSYVRSDADGDPTTLEQETLISNINTVDNQMFLGQIGFRYYKYYKRWTLSGEFRAFAGPNQQYRNLDIRQYRTVYDGVGTGSEVTLIDNTTGAFTLSETNNEVVWGIDTRAEAAYQVTRYISLRAGWSFTDFMRGIWRGSNPNFGQQYRNDQDVILSGVTFGITLNR